MPYRNNVASPLAGVSVVRARPDPDPGKPDTGGSVKIPAVATLRATIPDPPAVAPAKSGCGLTARWCVIGA